MRDRISKPRVFLSHSAIDKEFINRLAVDLRKCQIEPWLDTEEIRDGRPWLRVIFEDGIPACDAVLIYLTENSLKSKMVAKEMDATLVEQLGESAISVLPYVSKAELRGRLRSDVRTLQCREWNIENYHEVLPSVVAEIWRSYLERTISEAVLIEKNKRLEHQLELQSLKERLDSSPFTLHEEKEFEYIYDALNVCIQAVFEHQIMVRDDKPLLTKNTYDFEFSLLNAVNNYVGRGSTRFDFGDFSYAIKSKMNEQVLAQERNKGGAWNMSVKEFSKDIVLELKTYGLIRRVVVTDNGDIQEYFNEITDKMYRFRYWLDYNKRLSDDIGMSIHAKQH